MNAGQKWLQLVFDVVDKEFREGPLLSEGADDLVNKYPIAGRVFIVAVGAAVTLHLANLVDERVDLISQSFWRNILKGR